MYTIKVNYRTGNSFGSETCEEDIGLVWKDKHLARKCLKSIKEHWDLYSELDTWHTNRNTEDVLLEAMTEDWYPKKHWQGKAIKDKICFGLDGLQAEMDDGSFRQVPTSMWCGYFEELYGAKVVILEDDEDSFEV